MKPKNFYHLEDGKITIFFNQWVDSNRISGVFLRESAGKHEEHVAVAAEGEFVEIEQESLLVLKDGSVQIGRRGDRPQILAFDMLWKSTGLRGGAVPRRPPAIYEYGTIDFLTAFGTARNSLSHTTKWASEALKRFGAPLLTIAYTLIGLGLVIRGVGARADGWWRMHGIFGVIGASHAAIMLAAEGGISVHLGIAWLIVSVMVTATIVGVLLVGYQMLDRSRLPFLQSREPVPFRPLGGTDRSWPRAFPRLAPDLSHDFPETERAVGNSELARKGVPAVADGV